MKLRPVRISPGNIESIVDVADGQQIDNLDITDLLADNVVLDSVDAISAAGTTTTSSDDSGQRTRQRLVVTIPNVTGGPGVRTRPWFSHFMSRFEMPTTRRS